MSPQYRATDRKTGQLHKSGNCPDFPYGTRVASAVPMHVLKEYMGHADIATTQRYYLKTSDSDAKKVRAGIVYPPLRNAPRLGPES